MEEELMLTTIDNPYDPFNQFDQWYTWDETHAIGRPSCCRLIGVMSARSNALSDAENHEETKKVIAEIIKTDPFGIFTVVSRNFNNKDGRGEGA